MRELSFNQKPTVRTMASSRSLDARKVKESTEKTESLEERGRKNDRADEIVVADGRGVA